MRRCLFAVLVSWSLASGCGAARTAPAAALPSRPALPAAEASALQAVGVDPASIRCNTSVVWSSTLRADAKDAAAELLASFAASGIVLEASQAETARKIATDLVFWRMVLTGLIDGDHNNLGVVALHGVRTADGRPVVLYRTGFTPQPGAPGSCLESLVQGGGVRHAVNLYAGPMPTQALEAAERHALQSVGGTYLSARDPQATQMQWREDLRATDSPETRRKAMEAVAQTVRDLLHPGGAAPQGNLLVHCGGGMHRTGMVVGILERCVNGASREAVAEAFRRHVAWHSSEDPGGFEPANLDFIESFDCRLLQGP